MQKSIHTLDEHTQSVVSHLFGFNVLTSRAEASSASAREGNVLSCVYLLLLLPFLLYILSGLSPADMLAAHSLW